MRVTLSSRVTAADGRVLRGDREHFSAVVVLGGPAPRVPPAPPGHLGTPVADPYYDPASPVRLTGVFAATHDHSSGPGGTRARWLPELTGHRVFECGLLPALLLDGLARTPTLAPGPDGAQRVAVPRRIARIDLHAEGGDARLAADHPQGILLTHDRRTGDCTAHTPSGRPVARITGLELTRLLPPPPALTRAR